MGQCFMVKVCVGGCGGCPNKYFLTHHIHMGHILFTCNYYDAYVSMIPWTGSTEKKLDGSIYVCQDLCVNACLCTGQLIAF